VIQAALESMANIKDKKHLINGLCFPQLMASLLEDSNSNHVLQKILEQFPPKESVFIYDAFAAPRKPGFFYLSTHSYGCRVLQKMFECLPDDIVEKIYDELTGEQAKDSDIKQFLFDKYGNYVMQHILANGSNYYWTADGRRIRTGESPDQPPSSTNIQGRISDVPIDGEGSKNTKSTKSDDQDFHKKASTTSGSIASAISGASEASNTNAGLNQDQILGHMKGGLKFNSVRHKKKILKVIIDNIIEFSTNKFASNIVEKMLNSGGSKDVAGCCFWFRDFGKLRVLKYIKKNAFYRCKTAF